MEYIVKPQLTHLYGQKLFPYVAFSPHVPGGDTMNQFLKFFKFLLF